MPTSNAYQQSSHPSQRTSIVQIGINHFNSSVEAPFNVSVLDLMLGVFVTPLGIVIGISFKTLFKPYRIHRRKVALGQQRAQLERVW